MDFTLPKKQQISNIGRECVGIICWLTFYFGIAIFLEKPPLPFLCALSLVDSCIGIEWILWLLINF
jgi:hypothetical protein